VCGKMGYFCTVCNSVTDAITVNSIIHHFHYRHGILAMQKCNITCGQQECSRTFDGVHALRMHLKRHHPVSWPICVAKECTAPKISAYRWDRNEIPTATKPEQRNSRWRLYGWISYFRFSQSAFQTTSIELLGPKNMGSRWNFVSRLQAEI
jgi:hypothetical protein